MFRRRATRGKQKEAASGHTVLRQRLAEACDDGASAVILSNRFSPLGEFPLLELGGDYLTVDCEETSTELLSAPMSCCVGFNGAHDSTLFLTHILKLDPPEQPRRALLDVPTTFLSCDFRVAFRVPIPVDYVLRVILTLSDGTQIRHACRDISNGGVGLHVPGEERANFRVGQEVLVTFASEDASFTLGARVARRERSCVGLYFPAAAGATGDRNVDLSRLVATIQRRWLARRPESRPNRCSQ